ncbi:hypothetical protein FHG87_002559 [Trinorchestia longiramus]|nr:hypothetical protein FHG87_002559 [Trinorchestia longiramus]
MTKLCRSLLRNPERKAGPKLQTVTEESRITPSAEHLPSRGVLQLCLAWGTRPGGSDPLATRLVQPEEHHNTMRRRWPPARPIMVASVMVVAVLLSAVVSSQVTASSTTSKTTPGYRTRTTGGPVLGHPKNVTSVKLSDGSDNAEQNGDTFEQGIKASSRQGLGFDLPASSNPRRHASSKPIPLSILSINSSYVANTENVARNRNLNSNNVHTKIPINFDVNDLNDDPLIQDQDVPQSWRENFKRIEYYNSNYSKSQTVNMVELLTHKPKIINSVKNTSHSRDGDVSYLDENKTTSDFLPSVNDRDDDHIALFVSTKEILLNNIRNSSLEKYIKNLTLSAQERNALTPFDDPMDLVKEITLASQNNVLQNSIENLSSDQHDLKEAATNFSSSDFEMKSSNSTINFEELVKVLSFFESVDWHTLFGTIFPSLTENTNETNSQHHLNSTNNQFLHVHDRLIDNLTLHEHDVLDESGTNILNATQNSKAKDVEAVSFSKEIYNFTLDNKLKIETANGPDIKILNNADEVEEENCTEVRDYNDYDINERVSFDALSKGSLEGKKKEENFDKTESKDANNSKSSRKPTEYSQFVKRCLNIQGRRNSKVNSDVLSARSLFDHNENRRMTSETLTGLGPLETVIRFNDRFLPVPMMKPDEPRNDLLSSLIDATNPIPYVLESFNGMRNMFNQKMEPVMNFYSNMNIEPRQPLRMIMSVFQPRTSFQASASGFRSQPLNAASPFPPNAVVPNPPQIAAPGPTFKSAISPETHQHSNIHSGAPPPLRFRTESFGGPPTPLPLDGVGKPGFTTLSTPTTLSAPELLEHNQFPPLSNEETFRNDFSGPSKDNNEDITQFDHFDIIHTQTKFPKISKERNQLGIPPSSKVDKILNIKIPTESGNNPIFEISLMSDGNIGILPVNEDSINDAVPTISLENMFRKAHSGNKGKDFSEAESGPNIDIVETAPRQTTARFEREKFGKTKSKMFPLTMMNADVAHGDKLKEMNHPQMNHPQSVENSQALRNSRVKLNSHFHPSLKIPSFINPNFKMKHLDGMRFMNDWETDQMMAQGTKYDFLNNINAFDESSVSHVYPSNTEHFQPSIINPYMRKMPLYSTDQQNHFYANPVNYDYMNSFYAPYDFVPDSSVSESLSLFSPSSDEKSNLVHRLPLSTPSNFAQQTADFKSSDFSASVLSPSLSSSSRGKDVDDNKTGSEGTNIYYIDITIPDTFGGASIIRRREKSKARSKRDTNQSHSPTDSAKSNRMTRLIQYTGWHPVDLNNPLNNQPTISYKPPTLQKVHFGEDPPSTKPLYPILPENPPVFVVRENKEKPEIDEIYGTEKFQYVHIEPKSKTIRSFKPAGNARVVKVVQRLDKVKGSDLMKRSPASQIGFFDSSNSRPNYDVSNFNFSNSHDGKAPDLDFAFSEINHKLSVPQPIGRLLPRVAPSPDRPREPSGRGMLPSTVTPQQLLQARLNLARLPLLSPLHGLFGSFTQIPLDVYPKRSGLPAGDSVVEEIPAPDLKRQPNGNLQLSGSEPAGTVVFARSRQEIDRNDPADYLDQNGKIDRTLINKTRLRHQLSQQKTSKTLAANSLSELLQIFRHINVTEPPPTPTTTPPPVTIMKGFRYTKPTEAPITTTTARPTTTKRFRLPTAIRYLMGKPKNKSYIENVLTTTARPPGIRSFTPARITIRPTLTPKSSKKVQRIPDRIFDRVAETNSLDGYLFSDSEPSPKYVKTEKKPSTVVKPNDTSTNIVPALVIPKALFSKRVSVRLVGGSKPEEEIVHTKNEEPLKSEFEIIYTKNAKTTTMKSLVVDDSPFTIIEGHSKVRVFRSGANKKAPNKTVSPTPATQTSTKSYSNPTGMNSSLTTSVSPSFLTSLNTLKNISDSNIDKNSEGQNDTSKHKFPDYVESDYDNYAYGKDVESVHRRTSEDYYDFVDVDEPSYTLRRPWQLTDKDMNETRSSLTTAPNLHVSLNENSGKELQSHQPPTLHFLEGLRHSLQTSVPTWQDLDFSASQINPVTVTRIPASISTDLTTSSPITVSDDEKQIENLKEFTVAPEESQLKPGKIQMSENKNEEISSTPIDDVNIATIIESIVTEPFESRPS